MKRRALLDVLAVVALGALFVAVDGLAVPKRWTFVGAAVALGGFAFVLARRGRDWWRAMGFRGDNLRAALVPIGGCTLALAGIIVAWARWRGLSLARADLLVLLPLYPIWGVVQQAVFQGVLHRRLMVLLPGAVLPVLATAVVFAAVHLGNPPLVGLTFAAGLLWSALYRRWPNLWALGLSHGVLAALVYPFILGDAPLEGI